MSPGSYIVGETTIRRHCTFRWTEPMDLGPRVYEVEPHHCKECIAELKRQGFKLKHSDSPSPRGDSGDR